MIESSHDALAKQAMETQLRNAKMQAALLFPGEKVNEIPYSGQMQTEEIEAVNSSLEISNSQIVDVLKAGETTLTLPGNQKRMKFDTFRLQGDSTIHIVVFPPEIEHLDALKFIKGGETVDKIDMGYINDRGGKFLISEDSAGSDRMLRSPFDQRRLTTVETFRGRYASQTFESDSSLDNLEVTV